MRFHYSLCVFIPMLATLLLQNLLWNQSTESISEALHILHSWNPEWNPKLWMCDCSDAEISALECCFPDTIVYLCDFHREQAWERWVKGGKHGLTSDHLLAELRACAWAQTGKRVNILASAMKNQYGTSNIQRCGMVTHVFSSGYQQHGFPYDRYLHDVHMNVIMWLASSISNPVAM